MQNHVQTHAQTPLIAIIGGSGLYEMQALQSRREYRLIPSEVPYRAIGA